jgi:hypothetical protein
MKLGLAPFFGPRIGKNKVDTSMAEPRRIRHSAPPLVSDTPSFDAGALHCRTESSRATRTSVGYPLIRVPKAIRCPYSRAWDYETGLTHGTDQAQTTTFTYDGNANTWRPQGLNFSAGQRFLR